MQLVVHRRPHTGEKPSRRGTWGKSYSQKGYLTVHQRTHTRERPFECHECGKTFRQKAHLSIHLRIHKGEKPYHCSECGRTFRKVSFLLQHQAFTVTRGPSSVACAARPSCASRRLSSTAEYTPGEALRVRSAGRPSDTSPR